MLKSKTMNSLWIIYALVGLMRFSMADGDGGGDGDGGDGAGGGADGDGGAGGSDGDGSAAGGLFGKGSDGDDGDSDDGGADSGSDSGDGAADKPDWVNRDHYWDKDKGEVNAEAIHKDLVAAQQQLAKGKPEAPEAYEYNLNEDNTKALGEIKAGDDPAIKWFAGIAKEAGVSQDNFDKMVNGYMEMAGKMAADNAVDPLTYDGEMAKLDANGENGKQIMGTINRTLQKMQDVGIFNEQDVLEFKLTGQSAEGASMLMKLLGHLGEQPIPAHLVTTDAGMSPAELDAMRWEKYESGPSKGQYKYEVDADFRGKVDKLYDKIHGSEVTGKSVVLGAQ